MDRAKSSVEFHYLGLPLAFRARGGLGTNWVDGKEYALNDQRPRTTAWSDFLASAKLREGNATVSREVLEELCLALHDWDQFFCDHRSFKSHDAEKVQTWVCGSPQDGPGRRDLHTESWKELVDKMQPYRKPYLNPDRRIVTSASGTEETVNRASSLITYPRRPGG